MPDPIDLAINDELVNHAIDLLRLDAHTRAEVLALLNEMQRELISEIANGDISTLNKARLQLLLNQTNTLITEYYTRVSITVDATLTSAAASTAQTIVSTMQDIIGEHIGAALPPPTWLARIASNTLIAGAPSGRWWAKQAADIQFRFGNAVRVGMARSETTDAIVRRVRGTAAVPGVMDVSRRNAIALVRSSIQAVAAEARRETFQRNRDIIKGIRQVSTLDGRTSLTCIEYSDQTWDLDYNPIPPTTIRYASSDSLAENGGVPRHWNCRSAEVVLTKTYKELGLDIPEPEPGMRAAEGESVPVGMSFDDWLSRRTEAQQNAQLGAGRAQLWRDGKITLQDLLDLRGNPMTVAQLQEKYGG